MKFRAASGSALRSAGFNPKKIGADYDASDGPFAPVEVKGRCPCCSTPTTGWSVVNLQTAIGHSQDWFGSNAEVDAHECAAMLNAAWTSGHETQRPKAHATKKRKRRGPSQIYGDLPIDQIF